MTWTSKSKDWIEQTQQIHRMLIRRNVAPFEDPSTELKQRRIDRARADVKFFNKTYLPQFFNKPFANFHDELIWFFMQRDRFFGVFIKPKKHGGTSIRIGWQLHQGCYGSRNFQILTSQNEDMAIRHLLPIKVQFEENPRIIADFGELRKDGRWEANEFALISGCMYLARGIGQPHRGLMWFESPPDLVIGDDIEDKKNTANPQICKERIERIKEEVYDCLDDDGAFVWLGNWNRNHSAMAQLWKESQTNNEIKGRNYPAMDGKGRLLWPGGKTKKKLMKIKKVQGTVSFNREYMNRDAEVGQDFPEDKVKYYKPREVANLKGKIVSYGDPAKHGKKKGHSYHAWITLLYHKPSGIYYCLNAWIKHTTIQRWVTAWFNIYHEFKGQGFFEAVGAQENYKELFKPEANARGVPAPRPRDVRKNKEDRIVDTLSPLWENGRIRFLRGHSDQDKLIEQFIYFGATGMEMDGPDAFEGAVRNLKKGGSHIIALTDPEEEDDWA